MARMVVKGVPPYDGEYELDEDRAFNAREWRWIKQVSGYMPLTIGDGFKQGDPVLWVALTVVAMARSGKVDRDDGLKVAEELGEAPFDGVTISLVGDETEEDELPLVLTSEPAESSRASSSDRPSVTGSRSRSGSGRSDENQPPTTLLRSGTS